ncbi:MAG: fused MFS/spermidine synthase [Betaproteobacteria bacterium]
MILYATTIFLSAFLLFQVQPLIAKLILPWFGGSAAVWTTCMLFFQILLLGGYVYSHALISIRKASHQRLVHCVLLAVCLLTLPIAPEVSWKPVSGGDPTWRILGLLATTVGLPYFALSTTGPLVQAWYARTHIGSYPYRLFALSNFGSLLALLSYPLLVEPWLSARWQTIAWSSGFALFALLCATLAWKSTGHVAAASPGAVAGGAAPGIGIKAWWAGLACCASVLLLAFTSHLSLNIAPIPFLWVMPLSLYLLSFIVSFEAPRWYRRDVYFPLLFIGLAGVCYTLIPANLHQPISIMLPLYALTLFCACMVCHGELARSTPHPRYLTTFYLQLAFGGALGGLFVGVLAPQVFNDLYELPIGLTALAALAFAALYRDRRSILHRRFALAAQAGMAMLVTAVAGTLAWNYGVLSDKNVTAVRNFYAVLKVGDAGTGDEAVRELKHGTIQHGSQFLDPARREWPTTYYGPASGVALAIKSTEAARRIGVVGLGAGTLASFGRAGDVMRFYEIDPQVVDIARKQFSFLGDSKAAIEVVLGDARLTLEREPAQQFNVLAVDAFSSDSIPVHLLTIEAFRAYLRHLKPDGILAIHVSNRYLDLLPVVAKAAQQLSLQVRQVYSQDDYAIGVFRSDWLLLAASDSAFDNEALQAESKPLEAQPNIRLWTDDYSDLHGILK